MQYYPNTYYMTIFERFTAIDGKPSVYTRMYGNGSTTYKLVEGNGIVTKSLLKEKVEKIINNSSELTDFNCTETEYGWQYERFVKWLDEDRNTYEIVPEGQHTDHEVYTVDISYFDEVYDIFKKLI